MTQCIEREKGGMIDILLISNYLHIPCGLFNAVLSWFSCVLDTSYTWIGVSVCIRNYVDRKLSTLPQQQARMKLRKKETSTLFLFRLEAILDECVQCKLQEMLLSLHFLLRSTICVCGCARRNYYKRIIFYAMQYASWQLITSLTSLETISYQRWLLTMMYA